MINQTFVRKIRGQIFKILKLISGKITESTKFIQKSFRALVENIVNQMKKKLLLEF